MNDDEGLDDLGEFEQLLHSAPLLAPTAALDERVRGACRRRVSWKPVVWAAAGLTAAACAAVAVGMASVNRTAQPRTTARSAEPVAPLLRSSTERPTMSRPVTFSQSRGITRDDGIVGEVGGEPVRRFAQQTVQQFVVVDPGTGRRLSITVPRQQVVVVRVNAF